MDLYVYDTPFGPVADYRPYLDGMDHSFDDHRPLRSDDRRWEKIDNLRDPEGGRPIGGKLRFVGRGEINWRELMMFPIRWHESFERVEWTSEAAAAAGV